MSSLLKLLKLSLLRGSTKIVPIDILPVPIVKEPERKFMQAFQLPKRGFPRDFEPLRQEIDPFLDKLQNIWKDMLDNGNMADGTVRDADGEEINVHRAVLVSGSEYFANAFKNSLDRNRPSTEVNLFFDRHVIIAVLGICYAEETAENLSSADFPQLCYASEYILSEELSTALEDCLISHGESALRSIPPEDRLRLIRFLKGISFPRALEMLTAFS